MNLDDLLQEDCAGQAQVRDDKSSASRMQDLEMILNVVRKINTSLVL